MQLFGPLYDRVLHWASHPKARWYLAGLSFAESSFFPVPPDVMLAPMTLARPADGFRLALITTVASVAGGLAGYAIGYFALDFIEPWMQQAGHWDGYLQARGWFERWGFLAVLAAGFSPIPYKLFTIASGALAMFLPAFVVASFIGRAARFYLVAGLISWGGPTMQVKLRRNVEIIGWLTLAVIVLIFLFLNF
ncbi:MAG: YqaA family protein [Gammaproteobacteria bacterium]